MKLFAQIFKFVIVGGISFLVDFVVYAVMCNILYIHYIIAGIAGFSISVIVNYILSMRFVFQSKGNIRKDKEFVLFVVLSLIGMLLNSFVLFICIDLIFMDNIIAKIIATAIVMVYNFVSRKIFLEKQ